MDHGLGVDAQYRRRRGQFFEEQSVGATRPRRDHGDELVTTRADIEEWDVASAGEDLTEGVYLSPQHPNAHQHHAVDRRAWRRGDDPDRSRRQQFRPASLHHPGGEPQHGSSPLRGQTAVALQGRNQPLIPFIKRKFHHRGSHVCIIDQYERIVAT